MVVPDDDDMNPTARLAMENEQKAWDLENSIPFEQQNHSDLDEIRGELSQIREILEDLPGRIFDEERPERFIGYVRNAIDGMRTNAEAIRAIPGIQLVLMVNAILIGLILWRVW